ncbi:MAG TPA: LacI family DNA-binding transcriptional regulator [Galbitalea sp.]|jgi:LacI family transcriptional regulator
MTTIVDVARMANVSVSTVSHVMNGTKKVSDETRMRVETAIKESQFTPHQMARSLRSGRTKTIGLVVSDTSQFIFGQVISQVEQGIRTAGQTLVLANSGEDATQEKQVVQTLLDHRVDGMIIAPVADSDPAIFELCAAADCPVVVIDRISGRGIDRVGIDNEAAMRSLTRHLIDAGHKRIALIAGDVGVSTLRERADGYLNALDEAGLPVHTELLVTTDRGLGDHHREIETLLSQPSRPTAMIAASGLLTLGALRAFRDVELTVPRDIAFVSFDGVMNSEFIEPQLTCYLHPVEAIGREAAKLLARRLADRNAMPVTIRVPGALFHGTSCGCGGLVPLTMVAP